MKTPPSSKNAAAGPALVILAGACWGIISLFVRMLTAAGFDSMQIITIRAVFSAALLFVWFLIRDRSLLMIRLKDLWVFCGTGILSLTFFSWCYFTSIVKTGAAVAVVLLYTSPIFVMLMSALVFKEKITKKKLAALLLTFLGCVLVAGLAGSSARLSAFSVLLGLGSGFGYALYSIFAGIALKKGYRSLTVTFYTFLFSGIALLFLTSPVKLASGIVSGFSSLWPWLLGIAVICTVIPYLSYTAGLGKMEAGRAAVLVTTEPLVGTILGIACYHESADFWKLTGIFLIFASVLLLSFEPKSRQNHKENEG